MLRNTVVHDKASYWDGFPIHQQEDDGLNYRYIKMKSKATTDMISELESIFELNRYSEKIEQMREDVVNYEKAVIKYTALAEHPRLKEQAAKEQEQKAKSIKEKQNDSKPQ